MTQLTGTEKQITWAEQIRAKMLLAGEIDQIHRLATAAEAKNPAQADAVRRAIEIVRDETSAAWWIDRRDSNLRTIVVTVAKGL